MRVTTKYSLSPVCIPSDALSFVSSSVNYVTLDLVLITFIDPPSGRVDNKVIDLLIGVTV